MGHLKRLGNWVREAGAATRKAYYRAVMPLWVRQARDRRERLCANYVVVTGSCGKSTTTMLAAHLVGAQARTESQNIHNTLRWVTRKLRKLRGPVDYLIQETTECPLGTLRRVGEFAGPDAVIITSIGTDHRSEFRNREGAAAELREAVLGMSPQGVLCVPADDPLARDLATSHPGPAVLFGVSGAADFRAVNIRSGLAERLAFDLHVGDRVLRVRTRFVGTMMLTNVLAALALVHGVGLDLDKAVAQLADIEPIPGRMSVVEGPGGHTYLLDLVKASLWSTRLVVDDLPRMSAGRRIFVLSEMSDIGPNTSNKYRQILRLASDRADLVVGIDQSASAVSRLRGLEPSRTNLRDVANMEQLADLLRGEPPSLVVLKGNAFDVSGLFGVPVTQPGR